MGRPNQGVASWICRWRVLDGARRFAGFWIIFPALKIRGRAIGSRIRGEGLGLLENWLGCTLPESQQEDGLSVGAVGPQGASRWRDYPRRSERARSFAP
jgi:hypothetical protein